MDDATAHVAQEPTGYRPLADSIPATAALEKRRVSLLRKMEKKGRPDILSGSRQPGGELLPRGNNSR